MKRILSLLCLLVMLSTALQAKKKQQPVAPTWPDGTRMEAWFTDTTRIDVSQLGRQYVVTDYGVRGDDSLTVQTQAFQRVIDQAAEQGGGVIVVPQGVFLSGALHFRQGTHLWLQQGARLKGSDRIADFPVCTTRIEGQTCKYFPALVNADGLDGFTILGPGTIDGNGRHYWQEFWIRREWNPQCTNKDAQRPRLVYISNSKNVRAFAPSTHPSGPITSIVVSACAMSIASSMRRRVACSTSPVVSTGRRVLMPSTSMSARMWWCVAATCMCATMLWC